MHDGESQDRVSTDGGCRLATVCSVRASHDPVDSSGHDREGLAARQPTVHLRALLLHSSALQWRQPSPVEEYMGRTASRTLHAFTQNKKSWNIHPSTLLHMLLTRGTHEIPEDTRPRRLQNQGGLHMPPAYAFTRSDAVRHKHQPTRPARKHARGQQKTSETDMKKLKLFNRLIKLQLLHSLPPSPRLRAQYLMTPWGCPLRWCFNTPDPSRSCRRGATAAMLHLEKRHMCLS